MCTDLHEKFVATNRALTDIEQTADRIVDSKLDLNVDTPVGPTADPNVDANVDSQIYLTVDPTVCPNVDTNTHTNVDPTHLQAITHF